MRYMPQKLKKNNHISFGLMLLGLIIIFASNYLPMPFVFQIIAIILFTFSIQILQRYILSDFIYIVDDKDDGISVLSIVRAQGSKKVTVCSVELDKCKFYSDSDKCNYKINNSFDYSQNVFAESITVLLYFDGDSYSKIKLEANDIFKNELLKRMTV